MDARRRSLCEKVDVLGTPGCLTVWAWGWEVGQSQIIPEPQVPNSLANSFLQQVMGAFFFFWQHHVAHGILFPSFITRQILNHWTIREVWWELLKRDMITLMAVWVINILD